ncbi:MAG: hypothetical protein QNI84_05300 [Henriciella sp.]|nr:hypothetical protein [Henriciella sp.]
MADGSGYDLARDTQSLISIEAAIARLEAGDPCTGACIDIDGEFRLEDADEAQAPGLLQRLRGHLAILSLADDPELCRARPNPGAEPVLDPKVADILDALD